MFQEIEKIITIGNDCLKLSTGKLARNATSSVVLEMGDCFILCTVVVSKEALKNVDFVPLIVNYQEKTYAAGKIPGGFFKKEGKNSEREVLISRLIDRTVRPLLKGFQKEIQIICTVHSYDNRYNPDILSIIAASAALSLAGINVEVFASTRIGYENEHFVLNPSISNSENTDLNMIVSLTKDKILMIEADANFFSNEQILQAIKFAHEFSLEIINSIKDLTKEFFVANPNLENELTVNSVTSENNIEQNSLELSIKPLIETILKEKFFIKNKQEKYSIIEEIKTTVTEYLVNNEIEQPDSEALSELIVKIRARFLRDEILKRKIRIDGRTNDEIRNIISEVGILPSAHGSALFTRGETQSLSSVTLGTAVDSQSISSLDEEYKENFLLEYIFPPYATADIASLRAPSRREIGHGKLAWKSLKRALPESNSFPYTIRVVSEITESNGSSSMATVCAGSMALMNGGVEIKTPIAGVAMGVLISSDEKENMILTDITADEDHIGDMDCKIAGTKDSITAIQMDLKVKGVKLEVIESILDKSQKARDSILENMSNTIDSANKLKDSVPTIKHINISQNQIGKVIGPGGRTIKEISSSTSANIEVMDKELKILIFGKTENVKKATNKIYDIIKEFNLGQIIESKVVKIIDSGIFVSLSSISDGFIHISEISEERISDIRSIMKEGDPVKAKIIDIDTKGKIRLTIKNLDNPIPNKSSYNNYNDRTKNSRVGGKRRFTSSNNKQSNPQFKRNKVKHNQFESNVERKYYY